MPHVPTFSELEGRRRRLGWSMNELSRATGLSQSKIQRGSLDESERQVAARALVRAEERLLVSLQESIR